MRKSSANSSEPEPTGLGFETDAGSPELAALAGETRPTVLVLEPSPDLVVTPAIRDVCQRAMRYLATGQAVHLCGPAGTGKTTLAMYLAAQLGRPVVLIHGDDEHKTSDFVGNDSGYDRSRVVDNFIHSVLKTEESLQRRWVDSRLTTACKNGYVLVYDEFTRSRPEANNVLLAVLSERMLDIPRVPYGETYLKVHPDFAAIFTSNPEEYVGVHRSQDALLDRMVTLELTGYDADTETGIVSARSGLDPEKTRIIVSIARRLREQGLLSHRSTLRGAIVVGQVVARSGASVDAGDPIFLQSCLDVFCSLAIGRQKELGPTREQLLDAVASCTPASRPNSRTAPPAGVAFKAAQVPHRERREAGSR